MNHLPTPRDLVVVASPSLAADATLAGAGGGGRDREPSDTPRSARVRRALVRQPAVLAAIVTLAALVVVALLAPWIAPYGETEQLDLTTLKLHAPSLAYLFGTDEYSRDLLSRVVFGARVSLGVAGLSVALATLLGATVGIVAGVTGGVLDSVLMRTVDAIMAVPRVLLFVAVVGLYGALDVGTLVLLLAATGWMSVARLVRAEARATVTRDHVLAAHALGAGRMHVLLRHVLPACVTPAIVAATLNVPSAIALEAGLSYLGLGVQPPFASWGTIMRDGTDWFPMAWWLSVAPGVGIVAVMLACTTLGDALRDALDPRELSGR